LNFVSGIWLPVPGYWPLISGSGLPAAFCLIMDNSEFVKSERILLISAAVRTNNMGYYGL